MTIRVIARTSAPSKTKYMGPLIKTIMTRCIHCTLCVRFSTEVAGVEDMGLVNRGENAEITTTSNMQCVGAVGQCHRLMPGGCADIQTLCIRRASLGADEDGIDRRNGCGRQQRPHRCRGQRGAACLPRLHEDVNEEWISDKTRFAVRRIEPSAFGSAVYPEKWPIAHRRVGRMHWLWPPISKKKPAVRRSAPLSAISASVEAMFALKGLMDGLGSPNLDCRQDGSALDARSAAAAYRFNTTIAGIEEADACLIIGSTLGSKRLSSTRVCASVAGEGGFKIRCSGRITT